MSAHPEALITQGDSIGDSWAQEKKAYTSKKPHLRASQKASRKHVGQPLQALNQNEIKK